MHRQNPAFESAAKIEGCNFELHRFDGAQSKQVRLEHDFVNEVSTADLATGAYLWMITDQRGAIVSKGK